MGAKMKTFNPDLIVEVTSVCNRACSGCYAPNIVTNKPATDFFEKNPELFLRISGLNNAFNQIPVRPYLTTIRGGEPSLHPQLDTLLLISQRKSYQVMLETHARWPLVVSEEGYFENLEDKISEIQATGYTTLLSQKRDAEKALSQTDLDIRGVIRLQTQTEDRIALKLYAERLNELHLLRNEQKSQLAIISSKLEECPNPIELRKNIETNIKRFHKAWPKTPTALRKKLIQTVFDKLLIESDGIHVFYFAEETAKPNQSTGENPVDLSIYRGNKKVEAASHNEKVADFDIVRFGCLVLI